jgi:phosphoglycerate dehydrogenase-like enzyme
MYLLHSHSSLAEYVIGSCLYFAKSMRRLEIQKTTKSWDRFTMSELRGSTMGIIGYGDIGRRCAILAKAFGMRVLALRRRPQLSEGDENVDEMFSLDDLDTVLSESDYLVIAIPLTELTRGLIGRRELALAKDGAIVINVSRGPVIDENALIDALKKSSPVAGAALDVFTCEPLPKTSPLWDLPNVLLSPHNADMTRDFRHQSVKFFTQICHKFISGEEVLSCVVDKQTGY